MKNQILFFDTMLTSKIIVIIYWLLLAGICIGGLSFMFSDGFDFVNILGGIVIILLGGLTARVWCELLIVIFKINDNLQAIRDQEK